MSMQRQTPPGAMQKSGTQKSTSPSQLIDARIKELGDWRGKSVATPNSLRRASPAVV